MITDKHVQSAVEDRFCDSSISVREVSLELVGRYITSHPDFGVKVLIWIVHPHILGSAI